MRSRYDCEWIAGLKVGDRVFVSQPYGQAPTPSKVSRLSPTRVFIRVREDYEQSFHKANGQMVGSGIHHTHLIQPTEEVEALWRVERLQRKAKFLRGRLSIPATEEELEAFIAALSPLVKEEQIVPKGGSDETSG